MEESSAALSYMVWPIGDLSLNSAEFCNRYDV